jgi:hypothetical protein
MNREVARRTKPHRIARSRSQRLSEPASRRVLIRFMAKVPRFEGGYIPAQAMIGQGVSKEEQGGRMARITRRKVRRVAKRTGKALRKAGKAAGKKAAELAAKARKAARAARKRLKKAL